MRIQRSQYIFSFKFTALIAHLSCKKSSNIYSTSAPKGNNKSALAGHSKNKKRRNATKTRFSTIQPSIYVTGIRNKRWQR